jgi:hypothetical protein
MKAKRKVILAKIESVYGTDAAPVVGSDAMLVHNFSAVPIQPQYVERDPALPHFGTSDQLIVGKTMSMQFDVELAGAGAVDTAAPFGVLLRGCAHAQTITPTTGPVDYEQVTTGEESLTMWFHWDGVCHKMTGVRGNAELNFSAGGVPMARFTFVGLYGGISDITFPTAPTLSAWQKPLAMNKANTTFSLHGYAAFLRSLTINLGNVMQYVNLPNSESIRFIDRKMRGSVTIDLPTVTLKDYFTIVNAETAGALALTHGTAVGNKFIVAAGQVQLTNPSYGEADGTPTVSFDLGFKPTAAGNDEAVFSTQ